MSRQIITFHGGVHPPEHKAESSHYPIRTAPLPARLILSLQQSIGSAAKPLVKVGDEVAKGQLIAAADGMISAALHAPTSGRIESIGLYPVAHPSGLSDNCIVLIPDGKDQWQERPLFDWRNAEPSAVRTYLRDMGVVGLGGAVFPSHLKLSSKTQLDTLIINGAECEPYITCDDRLMRERAAEIVAGILMVQSLLNAKQVLIGIEDNKPEAAAALRDAIKASRSQAVAAIDVVQVPTLYPSGGAKQLIKLLCNIEVPSGVRSTDLGVQCFNVATIHSIYCALAHAEPVIRRVVTITGNVERPGNYEALIGTPLTELLKEAGDKKGSTGYIYGGPMMGFELPSLDVGLSKAGNCVIAKTPADFPEPPREMPCIRCSKCAEACPAELQPMDLFWFAKSKNFGKAQERNLFDCIECGACAYVCPSNIRLVDYYRFAKSEIWAAEKTKHAADLARERFEFRAFRAEREKQEKAERLAAKATQKLAQAVASDDPEDAIRAAKIKAAMARAAGASEAPASGSTATPEADQAAQLAAEKKAKIAAAMARAAAKKAEAEAAVPVVRNEEPPMAPSQAQPASSMDKTDRTKEILDKRREERARIAAMSQEERSAWEAAKKIEIEAAKAAAAQRKATGGKG
jgi:Na+-translocating ferredoxin:NAD+ oxidoreductase subunit C